MRNLSTRIKINPETYLKFQGNDLVILKNVFGDKAVEFKYDIMLLLYDMLDWKVIGDLIGPWPKEDQEKILNYLDMFYESKIVIHEGSDVEELPESGMHEGIGRTIHINSENHHNMLKDHVRMTAYRRAIERVISEDSVAMDLGCGSGVLAFFAARAGAKKVYGLEKQPHIVMLAEELAKQNNIEGIEFIEGTSSQITSEQLDPRPNVLISEIIGNAILDENILEFTLDARNRFLEKGGKLLPWRLDIYAFAYDADVRMPDIQLEIQELKDLYNLDFSLLGDVVNTKTIMTLDRYQPMEHRTMSDPTLAKSLDFYTLENPFFQEEFDLMAKQAGRVNGFCAYFKVYLDEETTLTNSPWAPQTHWTQVVFKLPTPIMVEQDEAIPMTLIYDGAIRLIPTIDWGTEEEGTKGDEPDAGSTSEADTAGEETAE